ncbi:MAG: ribonuclease PH, partial [Bryobacteraceae bacterium]|nr:ribonuclease PH [Bryobacteraceae bacterium]
MRIDGRDADTLRTIRISPDYLMTAEGSVMIECGHTRVLCAASVEESTPSWLRGTG